MTGLTREYGEGLYALCAEENLTERVMEELEALTEQFREQPDFLRLLANRSLRREERLTILDETLRGRVHPYVLNYLKLLLEKGLLPDFCESVKVYRAAYYRENGFAEAVATVAAPLGDEQRRRLTQKLCEMSGKKILLKEKLDPSLLGGVTVELDGRRYDNTLRRRLSDLHDAMLGSR